MSDGDWQEAEWIARAGSTRPVRIAGEDHMTAFAREALEGFAQQVRDSFVPITIEHLDYLPPIGRWYDGRLVDAADGHTELELVGKSLEQFVPRGGDPANPLTLIASLDEADPPSGLEVTLSFEARNFPSEAIEEINESSPLSVHPEVRWAELPPIVWTISIPVVWGATKFAGSFFQELGKTSATAFAAWVKRMWDKSHEPERDRILAARFELPDGAAVTALTLVPFDAPDAEDILAEALDRLGDVAAFVGLQSGAPVFASLKRAVLIFQDGEWHLGWWTDGASVYRTHWFDQNVPDPSRFLGRTFLDGQEASS